MTGRFGTGARQIRAWLQTKAGRAVLRATRRVLFAAVVVFLAVQVSRLGWSNVLAALPRQPAFYALFVLMYFLLPLTESGIYRRLLGLPYARLLSPLVRKRVLNRDVMDYSGEMMFFGWVSERSERPRREVAHLVKDNALMSATASFVYVAGVLGVAGLTGLLPLFDRISSYGFVRPAAAALFVAALVAVVVRFRRDVFLLPGRTLAALLSVHLARITLLSVLQLTQWHVVLPDYALTSLIMVHVVQVVAIRIPFIPARDLLFAGAAIELAGLVDVSAVGLAGALLTAAALDKVLNLGLLVTLSARDRRRPSVEASDPPS